MPKIKIGKTSLYYEVKGGGKPLLLIAGLGSDSSSWFGVSGTLSRRFKVIVFDNPGTGRSSAMEKPFTIAHMADVVAEFLEYLKIKRANILGHSMGGYIAQELAVNYPECVDKLIWKVQRLFLREGMKLFLKTFIPSLKKKDARRRGAKDGHSGFFPESFSPISHLSPHLLKTSPNILMCKKQLISGARLKRLLLSICAVS
jgi:hypothetical protein